VKAIIFFISVSFLVGCASTSTPKEKVLEPPAPYIINTEKKQKCCKEGTEVCCLDTWLEQSTAIPAIRELCMGIGQCY